MNPSEDLLIINEREMGMRLDKILSERFHPFYSRSYFQYLIEQQLVLLNGQPIKKRIKPKLGDEVDIQFAVLPESSLSPEPIPLSIIYEDEFLLVVNKPAGMVVHPAPGNWSGTFVNALLHHCHQLEKGDGLRPGIVHRLDKGTSGLLLAAKTLSVQQQLIAQFASRQVYKEYLTICCGRVPDGEIDAPIGRHPVHRKEMAIVETGKPAKSLCQTLLCHDNWSFIRVVIVTGRTHQIRLHLKHKGCSVVGDEVYGLPGAKWGVNRPLLHAAKMRFHHPVTKQELTLTVPLPEDMLTFMHHHFP